MLYIDPVECIDCGACVPVCPVSAIFAESDLPDHWSEYEEVNRSHYEHK
jgi:ferredoxin